jgi:hypothetical protein
MKTSSFASFKTIGQQGGSLILDRIVSKLKLALDALAQGQISNVSESAGVWLVSPGPAAPTGNPPSGMFYVYADPVDGKWKSRGSNGTITILGAP